MIGVRLSGRRSAHALWNFGCARAHLNFGAVRPPSRPAPRHATAEHLAAIAAAVTVPRHRLTRLVCCSRDVAVGASAPYALCRNRPPPRTRLRDPGTCSRAATCGVRPARRGAPRHVTGGDMVAITAAPAGAAPNDSCPARWRREVAVGPSASHSQRRNRAAALLARCGPAEVLARLNQDGSVPQARRAAPRQATGGGLVAITAALAVPCQSPRGAGRAGAAMSRSARGWHGLP